MPVDIAIDQSRDVIRATLTGLAGTDEVFAAFTKAYARPEYHRGMAALVDARDYPHQNSIEDVRRIADFLTRRPETAGGVRLAVVVSRPVSYGMMRQLQAYLDASPLKVSIFYDLEEAERWLAAA